MPYSPKKELPRPLFTIMVTTYSLSKTITRTYKISLLPPSLIHYPGQRQLPILSTEKQGLSPQLSPLLQVSIPKGLAKWWVGRYIPSRKAGTEWLAYPQRKQNSYSWDDLSYYQWSHFNSRKSLDHQSTTLGDWKPASLAERLHSWWRQAKNQEQEGSRDPFVLEKYRYWLTQAIIWFHH